MTTGRLSVRIPVLAALTAAVTAFGTYALPIGAGQRLFTDATQLAAGALAAWACFAGARDHEPVRARWRAVLGAGLVVWALTRLWWIVRDVTDPARSGPAGIADVGLVALPVCTIAALLLASAVLPRPGHRPLLRTRLVLVLDGVLVAGSIVAITWTLLPERVADVLRTDPVTTGVAAAYPVGDLLVVVLALLLLISRPMWRPALRPLWLAVAAMLAFGWSDTARLLSLPGGALSPFEAAGYLLGPGLLALVAVSNPAPAARPGQPHGEPDWLHLLVPYVPVLATGVIIAARTGSGQPLPTYEAYLGWLALGLVVARQMFTIADNAVLLARVSEGQQRLHHQAYHDPLTGLANRALFRERLVRGLDDFRRQGTPLALLFADLDDFKVVNDSYGHAMGDRLLRAIGVRLAEAVGAGDDLVARLGGDEFAVLLRGRAGAAEEVGERILAALREPYPIDDRTIGISASVGLVLPEPGDRDLSADALLRRADAAMYAGKRRGKNALARYTGGADGGADADLPHLLMRALAGDPAECGFEVHYQPIVRLSDNAVVAVEALARWTDPVAGPVHPDVFVTVAERAGLVAAIDDFVLNRACADMGALARAYGRPVAVHVNVSAARLAHPGLVDGILLAVERHHVRASRLVVEITETRRVPDLPRAVEVVAALRRRDIRVALDDFGSGYNALAQLHSLPVDIVKLDSTLTDVDVAPEQAVALCRSVVRICADLGVAVIAEGIETEERGTVMGTLGCALGQGYLYGQPRPIGRLSLPAQRLPDAAGRPAESAAMTPAVTD